MTDRTRERFAIAELPHQVRTGDALTMTFRWRFAHRSARTTQVRQYSTSNARAAIGQISGSSEAERSELSAKNVGADECLEWNDLQGIRDQWKPSLVGGREEQLACVSAHVH